MPNPPIVWHLDTEKIKDFSYNPEDRLTLIRRLMQCFEDEASTATLKETLQAIEEVCENKFTPKDLTKFLEKNGCQGYDTQGDSMDPEES